MILSEESTISPILLTVTLITYLIIAELSHDKIKKAILPAIIVLIVVFAIMATVSIVKVYLKLS